MSRLFISVGEASGDSLGAELLARIRHLGAAPTVQAIAGRRLREAGVEQIADCTRWGALGILEAIKVGPRVLRGYLRAKRVLAAGPPGLFLPIDFGFTNVKLARHAKNLGWQVLYFMPPGSWRRDKQGADLAGVADRIVTPFSWSAELLRGMGAQADWFGHPLKELVAASPIQTRDDNRLAALPGSRSHEIEYNVPAIASALPEGLECIEFAVAPSVSETALRDLWHRLRPDVNAVFTTADVYGVLRRARAALVCSGTATLEAALCACPCVVIYRGSRLMEVEYRIRKPKFEFISLPNILLRRQVVAELIQQDANPKRMAAELSTVWEDGKGRVAQLAAFSELDEMLGPPNALSKTAELVCSMLGR